ncbi:GNAT family N-acetyltransferase [Sporosarcina sp. NPDC096371]|uniref:GNAT family N-acetyltransferase n=1 Tax=Sporosarcina sp. NPDC096371 TaxID=3364530 RepID=UPI003829E2DA
MKIVQATINDLDALTELFDLYRLFYEQQSDTSGARAFMNERLSNGESVVFMALDNNEATGFVQLYPSFSSVSMKRTWVLNDLYVKEKARGKGFGEKLIREAIAFAEGTEAKGVLLETGKENVGAQRLYEKIGFIKETNHFYFFSV